MDVINTQIIVVGSTAHILERDAFAVHVGKRLFHLGHSGDLRQCDNFHKCGGVGRVAHRTKHKCSVDGGYALVAIPECHCNITFGKLRHDGIYRRGVAGTEIQRLATAVNVCRSRVDVGQRINHIAGYIRIIVDEVPAMRHFIVHGVILETFVIRKT